MSDTDIEYQLYSGEEQLDEIARLIEPELSEPYSFYIYRLFVTEFPHLCFLALHQGKIVGVVLSKIDPVGSNTVGYIGMLVVHEDYRGKRIGSTLVRLTSKAIRDAGAAYACIETETHNLAALTLYENIGFIRSNFLPSYYLNNSDAYRLKLWFKPLDVSELDIEAEC